MPTAPPTFEPGDTRQFTIVYSAAPSVPILSITAGSGDTIVVGTWTGQASSALAYYAFVTLPQSRGVYTATWVASFTVGPVIARQLFVVARTGAW
jgi:hypothetical protein